MHRNMLKTKIYAKSALWRWIPVTSKTRINHSYSLTLYENNKQKIERKKLNDTNTNINILKLGRYIIWISIEDWKKKKTSIRQYKHRIDSMKMLYYESILKLLDHHIPNVHQIAEKLIVIKKKKNILFRRIYI